MSAATIVFSDLVGFSKKPTSQQKALVEGLNEAILTQVNQYLHPDSGPSSIVALPTGDGVALAFLHDIPDSWTRTTIFELLLHLQQWAENQSSDQNKVELRIGVHVGTVELVTDINNQVNVCGDTINFTQRIMDAASPKQVLLSDVAFRTYIGAESPVLTEKPFSNQLQATFPDPVEVHAKHGLQIQVYKMIMNPEQSFWSNEDPIAKSHMLVSLTDLPKKIVGSFSERVEKATKIAFVMLTGDQFIDDYNKGNIKFSDTLNRFWVFMPDPKSYSELQLPNSLATSQFVEECVTKWREMFHKLRANYPDADLKLGLFSEPPFLGGSFLDWDRPKGKVHVSPYIWGISAPKCPGYDLEWIGSNPSPVYERYVEGLNYLNSKTTNSFTR